QAAVAEGAITSSQGMLASLCRRDRLQRSARSGLSLCPRHARTVSTSQGAVILSMEEAASLERRARRQSIRRAVVSLLIEDVHEDPLCPHRRTTRTGAKTVPVPSA